MKKVLSLVVALGVATLFSSAALAGADCNPSHKTQAAVDRTEASKDVATVQPGEKVDPEPGPDGSSDCTSQIRS